MIASIDGIANLNKAAGGTNGLGKRRQFRNGWVTIDNHLELTIFKINIRIFTGTRFQVYYLALTNELFRLGPSDLVGVCRSD